MKAVPVRPTTDVRIAQGAPAHQAAGGHQWVQLRLDPAPDSMWREIFTRAKGIDRCELPVNGALLSVGHDGLADLKQRLDTIEAAIAETNSAYKEHLEKLDASKSEQDTAKAEVAEYLEKRFPKANIYDE